MIGIKSPEDVLKMGMQRRVLQDCHAVVQGVGGEECMSAVCALC